MTRQLLFIKFYFKVGHVKLKSKYAMWFFIWIEYMRKQEFITLISSCKGIIFGKFKLEEPLNTFLPNMILRPHKREGFY